MSQTIIQIGNSQGITIPKSVLEDLDLKAGSKVDVRVTADQRLVISKLDKNGNKKSLTMTPEFMKSLEGVNKRYGSALRQLAKL